MSGGAEASAADRWDWELGWHSTSHKDFSITYLAVVLQLGEEEGRGRGNRHTL